MTVALADGWSTELQDPITDTESYSSLDVDWGSSLFVPEYVWRRWSGHEGQTELESTEADEAVRPRLAHGLYASVSAAAVTATPALRTGPQIGQTLIVDPVGSSTAYPERSTEVSMSASTEPAAADIVAALARAEVTLSIQRAQWEDIADGMVSAVSQNIEELVRRYRGYALGAIKSVLGSSRVPGDVAAEVLKTVGQMSDQDSYQLRLGLLMWHLDASSAFVRDGALLGLSWLADPLSLPRLREAAQKEPIEELRGDMLALVSWIEERSECRL